MSVLIKQMVRGAMVMLLDMLLILISFFWAYMIRFDLSMHLIATNFLPEFVQSMPKLAIWSVIIKIACFYFFGLYQRIWKHTGISEWGLIVKASLIGNVLMLGLVFVTRTPVPRSIFIITFFLDSFFIMGVRLTYGWIRRRLSHGHAPHSAACRVLIVGYREETADIINEMHGHQSQNYLPIAIVDERQTHVKQRLHGVPVLGTPDKIPYLAQVHGIRMILIPIQGLAKAKLGALFDCCIATDCDIKALPERGGGSPDRQSKDGSWLDDIRDISIEDMTGVDGVRLSTEAVSAYIHGQKVLITGAGGSVGSELARQTAVYEPKELILLDHHENALFEMEQALSEICGNRIKRRLVVADIQDRRRIEICLAESKPDVIFHAAAHKHLSLMENNQKEAVRNNVLGTANMVEAADRAGCKRFILISGDKAVNPADILSRTQYIAEQTMLAFNAKSQTRYSVTRFGNVLDSNGSVSALFKKQIARGGPVALTHPEAVRSFMTVRDVCGLILDTGAMAQGGEVFMLDMGQPVKIYDLARRLIRLAGLKPDQDIPIITAGPRSGEQTAESSWRDHEGIQSTSNDHVFVIRPEPTSWEETREALLQIQSHMEEDAGDIDNLLKKIVGGK
jgi:FlaA1/EpsC-like NDP-sugar epimerase